MKTLELQIASVPVETPVKKDAFSVGVAYELSIDGAGKNYFINDIYDAERTNDLVADIQRRMSYGRMTDAERDAIIIQSAALIAKASETSSEGTIRREHHEICDGAGKRLASLRLESPYFWPTHEEMTLGDDDYARLVCGYFNSLKDEDAVTMILKFSGQGRAALRRDLRIAFEPRERTPWDQPIVMKSMDADPGLHTAIRHAFGVGAHAEKMAQMATAAARFAEASGRVVRIYDVLRDGNGVLEGVFSIEAPFYTPDPVAAERSPMDYFIRPEADAEAEAV